MAAIVGIGNGESGGSGREGVGGLVDLEKELSCSICTEVLYQPLTLLDCLHTFCGSCLKGWFTFQSTRNRTGSSSRSNPYTCPSCRASVRETRPNATVTTLLEMYLQANPNRKKSTAERTEIAKSYTPGENVLRPATPISRRTHEDDALQEADQRLLDQVRALSLGEVSLGDTRGPLARLEAPSEHGNRRRARSHEARTASRDEETRGRMGEDVSRSQASNAANPERARSQSQANSPTHQVEHQSSLRSLLSASEIDPSEIQEVILRQIAEEGLLDDVDSSSLDAAQMEELSERIAEAYRRRHHERSRHRRGRRSEVEGPSSPEEERLGRQEISHRHTRSHSATAEANRTRTRPSSGSQTHLELPPSSGAERRRGASDNTRRRRRESPQGERPGRSSDTNIPRARAHRRSPSDPHERPPLSAARYLEPTQQRRSSTDPTVPRTHESSRRSASIEREVRAPEPRTRARTATSPTPGTSQVPQSDQAHRQTARSSAEVQRVELPADRDNSLSRLPPVPTAAPRPRVPLFPEPSISCERCGRAHLEYELHFNCEQCDDGDYNLCLSCNREGKGCRHWFGFGRSAMYSYERGAPSGGYPSGHPLPHSLSGHRYLRPKQMAVHQPPAPSSNTSTPANRTLSSEDPLQRLEAGVFCAICHAWANDCYWNCDTCNEGEWGFCNRCVNTGRCCTHPLQPLIDTSTLNTASEGGGSVPAAAKLQPPPGSSLLRSATGTATFSSTVQGQQLKPLTFNRECDICHLPIQPSSARFHCPACRDGDYDICSPCYLKLCNAGKISAENGHKGWRRCLRGHRMLVFGFEDRDGGRKRVVSRDLVGGWALREDEPTPATDNSAPVAAGNESWRWTDEQGARRSAPASAAIAHPRTAQEPVPVRSLPPDGGYGLRAVALWSYYPAAEVKDELMFPRYAEIREIEDINGDWFSGGYAGSRGLFPGGYVRVLGDMK